MNTQADRAILAISETLDLVIGVVIRNKTTKADKLALAEAMTKVDTEVRELWDPEKPIGETAPPT